MVQYLWLAPIGVLIGAFGTLIDAGGGFLPAPVLLLRTVVLALGVLVGAQVGARLSHAIQGAWILRSLAVALGAVGVRILLHAFRS